VRGEAVGEEVLLVEGTTTPGSVDLRRMKRGRMDLVRRGGDEGEDEGDTDTAVVVVVVVVVTVVVVAVSVKDPEEGEASASKEEDDPEDLAARFMMDGWMVCVCVCV